ncbi:hypothetical protein, partial [Caballeronia sp. dw_19]|uniref:hypothetical protein n=1 Tax=Caballeronia sp. dw_19 TaxID=2719791 RepID=UPI001BD62223
PPAEFVRMTDHAANLPRNGAAKMRKAVSNENNCLGRAANSPKTEVVNPHRAVTREYRRVDRGANPPRNRDRKYV